MEQISPKDRDILRERAKKQLAYANSPIMRQRVQEWYDLNDLKRKKPMVQIELWTFGDEIIPPMLQCESENARGIEGSLLRNYLNTELFDDDFPVPDYYPIDWNIHFKLFNRDVTVEGATDSKGAKSVGYQFIHSITDLPKDLPTLEKSVYNVDREGTFEYKAYLEEIFGDILPVRISSGCLGASPTQNVVRFMGMENMFMAMMDTPDEFHRLMDAITDEYVEFFRWQEKEGLILPTNGRQRVGQGTWGFTRTLEGPSYEDYTRYDFTGGVAPLPSVGINESWGYMDSQETVGLSPAMFSEFIFPYYQKIARLPKLLSYGCCEPVDIFWDDISTLPNLRKVSVSPWCNEEQIGEALRGTGIVYQRKPSPNYVGVGTVFDEEGFAEHIARTCRAAKGCHLEFTMRDVYTINRDIQKARRAVAIIRRQAEKYWE